MPEDIADTYTHVSRDQGHRLGQSAAPAGSPTLASVTTTPEDVASAVPIESHASLDALKVATLEVPETAVAVDASPVPPAAGTARDDTISRAALLVQAQGKVLDEATLKNLLTECIKTGLQEAKAEGTNGWAEIDDALNDVDDDKIGSCKEDIDTLLTFAGLFSAALTAFVVESYQNLSPDPTDQMIQLLTQIAVQTNGYTVSGSHVNATLSGFGTTPQPFEPSPGAVLVNKLWFASLVLALITTSFGILIKQWLREYRGFNPQHSNIRSRLRIRQFRWPGLIKWRVFEFAAFLPLLIQLALGLFLLGLCSFTWSINHSIGRTLTVLVAAWIFFLVAFAFAPALSSSCPYKISLLSRIYPVLRSGLTSLWCLNWLYLGPRHEKSLLPWSQVLIIDFTAGTLVALLCYAWSMATKLLSFLTKGGVEEQEPTLKLSDIFSHGSDLQAAPSRRGPLEERNVAADTFKDLSMLSTVDEILLDDELLSTTMHTVIVRDQFRPEDITSFVQSILAHRLLRQTNPGDLINLALLPLRVADTVLNMLFVAIRKHTPNDGSVVTEARSLIWAKDALAILLSLSLRHIVIRDDMMTYVQRLSPFLTEGPILHPGLLMDIGASLQDLVAGLRLYFPQQCKDSTAIGRIHAARYCRSDCRHGSLAGQLRAHAWTSEEDHGLILSLIKDALDESVKQPLSSCQMEGLLWETVGSNHYNYCSDATARHRLAWHFIGILQDAPWSHVKSLLTSTHTKLGSQLLYTMTWASVQDVPSVIALNVDQPVSVKGLTRFFRLLTFALFYNAKNKQRASTRTPVFDLPTALPELWTSQHRRFTPASSLWSQIEACSAELTAVLYLMADFAKDLHQRCTIVKWAEEIQSGISAAELWCSILGEIALRLPTMKPYVDRALAPMRTLTIWHSPDSSGNLVPPPQYHMPDLSAEEEKRAKAAVAMVMQMFKSSSEEECDPISLADLEALDSGETTAARIMMLAFQLPHRGFSPRSSDDDVEEHELAPRIRGSSEPASAD